MFNLSGSEVLFILVIGLVVLGPEKLPQMLRRAGRLYGELRRLSQGVQSELKSALDEPTRELRSTTSMAKRIFTGNDDSTTTPPAAPGGTEPRFIPYPGPHTPHTDEGPSASNNHSEGSQSAAHTDAATNCAPDGAPADDRGMQDPPRHD